MKKRTRASSPSATRDELPQVATMHVERAVVSYPQVPEHHREERS